MSTVATMPAPEETVVLRPQDIERTVAMQNAMTRKGLSLSHGARHFPVLAGWEAAAIASIPGIAVAEDLSSLEAAVKDSDVRIIFLPKGGLMTAADIERIIHRNGVAKTLFQEVQSV